MTNHVVRLYAAAAALAAFFVAWAGIAARPWVERAPDPLGALDQRELRLRRDAVLVQQVVDRRRAAYRAALAQSRSRAAARAAAPAIRIVTLPPVATTRSS